MGLVFVPRYLDGDPRNDRTFNCAGGDNWHCIGWWDGCSYSAESSKWFTHSKSGAGAGLFLHLIGGLLGLLIGLLVVTHPVAGALAWTLLFASFLAVMGLFRLIAAAIGLKFPRWGWAVFDGTISLGLGILLWVDWPWSGLWFLGLSVGIALILRGWSYVMFAIAIRNLPLSVEIRRAA